MPAKIAIASLPAASFQDCQKAIGAEVAAIDCGIRLRLPTTVVAAVLACGRPVALEGVSPPARLALAVLGLSERLGVAASPDEQRIASAVPVTARIEGPGDIIINPKVAALQQSVPADGGHAWLGGIEARRVVVDLSQLDHVNSMLVAWLLQLSQMAKPALVELRAVRPSVATQLKQLKLNHLMSMD